MVLADIASPVLVNVVLAVSVTAPEYVCVPEVVTDPPRSELPVIVNAELPADLVMVPSRSNVAKVWVD